MQVKKYIILYPSLLLGMIVGEACSSKRKASISKDSEQKTEIQKEYASQREQLMNAHHEMQMASTSIEEVELWAGTSLDSLLPIKALRYKRSKHTARSWQEKDLQRQKGEAVQREKTQSKQSEILKHQSIRQETSLWSRIFRWIQLIIVGILIGIGLSLWLRYTPKLRP